jgi:hypothetical protein
LGLGCKTTIDSGILQNGWVYDNGQNLLCNDQNETDTGPMDIELSYIILEVRLKEYSKLDEQPKAELSK